VYELDLSSGKFTGVSHTEKDGFLCMDAPLVPLASRLYVFTAKEIPVAAASGGDQCALQKLPAPTAWDYTLGDHNVFVLDQAQCTVDGKELDKQVHYILLLDDLLRTEYLKCPARGEAMVQPWLNPANPVPDRVLDLELKYNFLCDAIPTLPVWLAIERPDLYEICLNDTQVELDDAGHWVDPSIRKILLPAEAFRSGVNFLVLKCKYHRYLPGLEACYLLGDFGVKNKRTLTVKPEKMTVGDWCEQKLPFYSGSVTYAAEVEIPAGTSTVKVELGKWAGAAAGIRFNDGEQQILGWPPYTASFTGGVKPGKNRVEITIFGSRRNAFGPFYDLEARPGWVGSEQLKAFLTNEKQLVPCGLLEEVSIYVGLA
jgi:hypothetical protein